MVITMTIFDDDDDNGDHDNDNDVNLLTYQHEEEVYWGVKECLVLSRPKRK